MAAAASRPCPTTASFLPSLLAALTTAAPQTGAAAPSSVRFSSSLPYMCKSALSPPHSRRTITGELLVVRELSATTAAMGAACGRSSKLAGSDSDEVEGADDVGGGACSASAAGRAPSSPCKVGRRVRVQWPARSTCSYTRHGPKQLYDTIRQAKILLPYTYQTSQ